MRKTLTDLTVKNAKPTKGDCVEIFDTLSAGLAIRARAEGRKTWTFIYTSPRGGKRARITLGTYPALSLDDARTAACEKRSLVEKGVDPRDVVPEPVVLQKSIAELIEDRLSMEVRGHLRSAATLERQYKRDVIPIVGSVPVKAFEISHLNRVVDPILARGKRRAAELVFTEMKTLFKFAVKRGEVRMSPITDAALPKVQKKSGEHFLSVDEIGVVWRTLPHVMSQSKLVPLILRLCLATGQRLGEVSGMPRSEIDVSNRIWTIPKERAKNNHEHIVPLNDLAWEIVSDRLRETNGEFLFPDNSGTGPLKNVAIDRTLLRAQQKGKFGIPNWHVHDLRRTVATQMSIELGIGDLIIGHVLNHRSTTKATVTSAVYNKNTYLKEKRDALDKWAAFLAKTVEIGRAA